MTDLFAGPALCHWGVGTVGDLLYDDDYSEIRASFPARRRKRHGQEDRASPPRRDGVITSPVASPATIPWTACCECRRSAFPSSSVGAPSAGAGEELICLTPLVRPLGTCNGCAWSPR